VVVPSVGEVVLVPFPFSDLSSVPKVRPAVCLAPVGRGDWILLQVTSNAYGDPNAVPLAAADFVTGRLLVSSFVRPGKLFTANSNLLLRSVGRLNDPALDRILRAVVNLIRPGTLP
jgi:mRNA interferase MazF